MLTAAPGRVAEGHPGRCRTAPGAVVPRQGPEVTGLCLPPPGVENRGAGLIHEQLGRTLQIRDQRIEDRPQLESGPSDPVGQGGTVEIDALTAVDLRLAIQRKMVGVFAGQHMRHRSFGRQAARGQPRRCRCLGDPVGAGAAGVFRAAGDDDAELRRNDVQPLRGIFADAVQATPARADQALGLDHLLDARQMSGQ